MKNQHEMRRTRELRARFDRLRREVEALEALPDVTGDLEQVDPSVFAEVSAVLDERDGVPPAAYIRRTGLVPLGLRG